MKWSSGTTSPGLWSPDGSPAVPQEETGSAGAGSVAMEFLGMLEMMKKKKRGLYV